MYSGNNVEYPTQWALNPSAYRNVSNDQVDWAALAQQWIQMKEACPPAPAASQAPAAPAVAAATAPVAAPAPAPALAAHPDEEGEAPMDVEGADQDSSWNDAWDRWGGSADRDGWNWQSGSSSKTPSTAPFAPGYASTDASYPGFTGGGQQNYRPGYWSTDDSKTPAAQSEPPGNRGMRRIPRQQNSELPNVQAAANVDTTQTIDAAKRRQLPAWIREGLEKMEREKQKQMDREREKLEREEYLKQKLLSDGLPIEDSKTDETTLVPTKSKFESDSNDSEPEEENDKSKKVIHEPVRLLPKTQEEIMQEVMLCVRRTLTEILLEVTDEQILAVCQEELSRKRSQPQASRGVSVASKSQALSSIGGQLGLGIYGDSSGESESESETEDDGNGSTTPSKHRKRADLTDGQLQETIRRKKAEFEKTSREIETQIVADEMALRRRENDSTSRIEDRSLSRRSVGNSGSDGEDSARNELNTSKQRKFSSDKTPPLDNAKRSFPDKSEKYSKHKSNSEFSSRSSRRAEASVSKRNSSNRYNSTKKEKSSTSSRKRDRKTSSSKSEVRKRSRSSSESSDNNRRKRSDNSDSCSESESSSSSSSSSASSHSSRSSKRKLSRKNKKKSVEDNPKSKKSKRDKYRSKKKENNDDESDSERKNTYDSESSNRKSRTPERRYSYKSKYSERSRSKSSDRHGSYYHNSKKHDSRYRYNRDRSRDRKSESYYRERSRDRYKGSKDERDRSKEKMRESKERYDKDKRSERNRYSRH